MKQERIFIYGVPGSGKTSLATALAEKLGWRHVELDDVRAKAQVGKDETHDPFVFASTSDAWQQFGELNQENVVNGLLAVRKVLSPYIEEEIQEKHLVAEAAFLDPKLVQEKGRCILVTVRNEDRHRQQFFTHREQNPEMNHRFQAARYNNEFLTDEAERLGIETLENMGSIEVLVNEILQP